MVIAIICLGIVALCAMGAVLALYSRWARIAEEKELTQGELKSAYAELAVSKSALIQQREDFSIQKTDLKASYEKQLENQKRLYESLLAEKDAARARELEDMRKSMDDKFKNLATQTLDATVIKHNRSAMDNIAAVLKPMREAFDKLSEEIERRGLDTQAERSVLQEGIKTLKQLNNQVSDETRRLTHALKGNSGFQGHWGEMVLENILEGSGLERSRWVVYQASTINEQGNSIRPDAVIKCPRGRDIFIDSKVSLTAYLKMIESEDDDLREAYHAEHLRNIETQLKSLSKKEYHTAVNSGNAGFVLMFIPHEGAYIAAMQADTNLWQRAYDRRVVIVSPTHLITVIRLVEQMWKTEDQTNNSLAIAEEATKMLDKLNDFLGDLADIEKAINKAKDSVELAQKHLFTGNGNVIRRAEKLQSLGIKTKKEIKIASKEQQELP